MTYNSFVAGIYGEDGAHLMVVYDLWMGRKVCVDILRRDFKGVLSFRFCEVADLQWDGF
jgi:hypothetical protein